MDNDRPETIGELDGSDLAAKLNQLFDTMHPRGVPPVTNYAAAKGIEEKTGVSITPQYLGQLRAGKKRNPGIQHLRAIAAYFGVSARYLLEPGPSPDIESQLEVLRILRDAGVRNVAARASGLSPGALANVANIIDQLRSIEQLPPVDPSDKDD
ncbi:helix-turn-helix transcriptional regulator [Mycolicibacterium sp. Y3]